MLSIQKLLDIGFIELKAPNGNVYYKKGFYLMVPSGIGWHFLNEKDGNDSFIYMETEDELFDKIGAIHAFRLPKKEDNIYPYTKKNVLALLNHYFKINMGDIQWIIDLKDIELNQLEYIAKKVSEHQYFLDKQFKLSGNTVSNYMKYGIDGLYRDFSKFKGSEERTRITKELRDLILNG
ncbi:hypothetical protein [Tamlana flava]|uniref:hypothetical protein n=1 Tax=Tamlana flava TaxID=3158572 RepID=UPI00351B9F4B